MTSDEKFQAEDLPKILAALKTAKDAGMDSVLSIAITAQGGVLSVILDQKKRFK